MSDRPCIVAEAVAAIIAAAPARVRKRLDRQPTAAQDWSWQKSDSQWLIRAGEETVALTVDATNRIAAAADVTCTCLLSPNCFHVLACVSSLVCVSGTGSASVAGTESVATEELAYAEQANTDAADIEDQVAITAEMRSAAHQTIHAIENVLTTGGRASGLVIQSSLLRAAHQCRARGLIDLSNTVIRISEGIRRLRADDDDTDSGALRRDIVTAILNARDVLRHEQLSVQVVGQVRRSFQPVKLSRLTGVIAEPILTLSGYAGVCVHLIAPDGRWFQVNQLQPGDAALIVRAYRGGIDLGALTLSAEKLSRASLDVQNLTASEDGRLGKGTKTRWAVRSNNGSPERSGKPLDRCERLNSPLSAQVDRAFSDSQRPGDDLVCFVGRIAGPQGGTLLMTEETTSETLRLGIAIDDQHVAFRKNLQLLARAPGMRLRVYGRLRHDSAGLIDALTIEPVNDDSDSPRLVLPDEWHERCHLGLDTLQRHHITRTERFASEVEFGESTSAANQPVVAQPLSRRTLAMVLGGRRAVPPFTSDSHRRDKRRLIQQAQPTAAELLDLLAISSSSETHETHFRSLTLAAAETYLASALKSFQHDGWRKRFVSEASSETEDL
ncbi:hypothetical protein [Rhodopirellula sp. MGV]|uniref:hypothetical protein n=1 Tax=Rhodopirellula sp. MGV TaxID=2023130 RepID=UPI000B95D94F|nr:hypothetical protein [Rhodopirellula sp. MGV]OYP33076.1 hypothetical protein CGZ80_18470 [Rhodopirellula sp. MGV]PNY37971.1 hypothetical protein C2E31_05595 [Rhodopirellula baltica]